MHRARIGARRDEQREHDPVVRQVAEQLEPAEHRQRDREQHRADGHDRARELAGHDDDADDQLGQAGEVRELAVRHAEPRDDVEVRPFGE